MTVQSAIQLYDGMSPVLDRICNTMNIMLASFANVQDQSAQMMDTTSLQGAMNEMAQVGAAMAQMEERIQRVNATPIMPEVVQPSWAPEMMPQVFQISGIERFAQESQSALAMANKLSMEQANIEIRAKRMNIFPATMMTDINSMADRVLNVRNQVDQLARVKMSSMGAERANAQMEVLRGRMASILPLQNEMNQLMQQGDVSNACASFTRLNQIVSSVEMNIRDNIAAQDQFNNSMDRGTSSADGLWNKIKGIGAAVGGLMGIQQVIGLSDELAGAQARLNLIVDDGGSVEMLEDKIMQSAQRSRASYLDTMQSVSKLGLLAGDAFSSNDEMIYFTELMNKNFIIAGASAQEQSAAMYQLNQALAAGKLQGDEYRSVIENAPLLAQGIEQYMQNAGVEGTMKDWASEGLLTAEVIKNALFASSDEVEERFNSMPMTWGQVWANIQNNALMAFEPVLQQINDIVQTDRFQNFTDQVNQAFFTIGNAAIQAFDVIMAVSDFMAQNWNVIEPIIWGIVGAVVAWKIAQIALNFAVLASPILWVAIAIGVVIGLIYMWIKSVGGLKVAWLIVVDKLQSTWDQVCIFFQRGVFIVLNWMDNMSLGISRAVVGIQNFFGDMKANILMTIENMANGAFDIINQMIEKFNSITGTSFEVIQHITMGTDAQLANEAQKNLRNQKLDQQAQFAESNRLARERQLNQMELDASVRSSLRQVEIYFAKVEGATNGSNNSAIDQAAQSAADINENTAKMANSMDITSEDLKYLRDMAERDTVNRFTTAQVKVEISNQNTISSELDLDGILSALTEGYGEAASMMAAGVHV